MYFRCAQFLSVFSEVSCQPPDVANHPDRPNQNGAFCTNLFFLKMARLRFPGRPGLRFDRLGVRYGSADEANRRLDPSTQLIANIHRGLRCFREYFGESDEVNIDLICWLHLA